MTTKMKKADLLRYFYNHQDSGLRFLCNVIHLSCSKSAVKLQTLYRLVQEGKDVRCAQFDCYSVSIDGSVFPISVLNGPNA